VLWTEGISRVFFSSRNRILGKNLRCLRVSVFSIVDAAVDRTCIRFAHIQTQLREPFALIYEYLLRLRFRLCAQENNLWVNDNFLCKLGVVYLISVENLNRNYSVDFALTWVQVVPQAAARCRRQSPRRWYAQSKSLGLVIDLAPAGLLKRKHRGNTLLPYVIINDILMVFDRKNSFARTKFQRDQNRRVFYAMLNCIINNLV